MYPANETVLCNQSSTNFTSMDSGRFGFVRNLINEAVNKRLSFKPPNQNPGNVQIIEGNGEALDLKGFAMLLISLGSNLL